MTTIREARAILLNATPHTVAEREEARRILRRNSTTPAEVEDARRIIWATQEPVACSFALGRGAYCSRPDGHSGSHDA